MLSRPLWQIVLGFLLASLALHRGAAAVIGFAGALPREIALGLAMQAVAAIASAAGLWLGARWTLAALLTLGVGIAATAIAHAAVVGAAAVPAAIAQVLVVAVGTAALVLVLRREQRGS